MKALVIGGAGFIGSHLVEQLKATGADVRVYDNFSRTERNQYSFESDEYGDIRDLPALRGAMIDRDVVFHLAALWLMECQNNPVKAFKVNIEGTFNVLRACVDMGIKRLVYSSSASVYGDRVSDEPMTEEHPYNNKNFYGATKIAGEHMLKAYHHLYGLEAIALRYMNVYGPGQDNKGVYTSVIVKTLDRINRGESPIIYGTGEQLYDFINVSDVARANICAMQSTIPFGFYNVGTGVGTSLNELVKMILHIKQSELPIIYEEQTEQTLVKDRIGSVEKTEKDLGFKATITLKEGLERYVNTVSKTVDNARD